MKQKIEKFVTFVNMNILLNSEISKVPLNYIITSHINIADFHVKIMYRNLKLEDNLDPIATMESQ